MVCCLVEVGVLVGLLSVAWFAWTNYFRGEQQGHQHGHSHGNQSKQPGEKPKVDIRKLLNDKTRPWKKEVFRALQDLKSAVPEMKKKDGLRVLEIGAGPGVNLEFYPPNTSLIVVEPSPRFHDELLENVKKSANVTLERCLATGAEDMKEVPDHSVDAVTSSFVHCNLPDVQKVYKEIQRVLAPGGKFLFIEHALDNRSPLMKSLESYFGWTGLFKSGQKGHGGKPHVDVEGEVRKGGFASTKFKGFFLDTEGVPEGHWMSHFTEPHIYGIATTSKN